MKFPWHMLIIVLFHPNSVLQLFDFDSKPPIHIHYFHSLLQVLQTTTIQTMFHRVFLFICLLAVCAAANSNLRVDQRELTVCWFALLVSHEKFL